MASPQRYGFFVSSLDALVSKPSLSKAKYLAFFAHWQKDGLKIFKPATTPLSNKKVVLLKRFTFK